MGNVRLFSLSMAAELNTFPNAFGAFGHKDMGTNDRGPTIVYHKVAYHKVVYHRMPYHTKVYLDTRAWAQTTGETLAR